MGKRNFVDAESPPDLVFWDWVSKYCAENEFPKFEDEQESALTMAGIYATAHMDAEVVRAVVAQARLGASYQIAACALPSVGLSGSLNRMINHVVAGAEMQIEDSTTFKHSMST